MGLRKKIERAKKIEMASSADEVLMEEIKEYKVSSQVDSITGTTSTLSKKAR